MDKEYWLGRKSESAEMARSATCAEARLIHFELAGRYSARAAQYRPSLVGTGTSPTRERAGAACAQDATDPVARLDTGGAPSPRRGRAMLHRAEP